MQKIFLILSLFLIGCAQNTQTHPPVGGFLSEKDMNASKIRSKKLNILERSQIQDWIDNQNEKFYPMTLNYWINIENLPQSIRKDNGVEISYEYEIFDFDNVKLIDTPVKKMNVKFGHFEELKAVEDALRYLNKNENATLLVPSVLAFGTYGDNKKISNDMPLIIKIKVL